MGAPPIIDLPTAYESMVADLQAKSRVTVPTPYFSNDAADLEALFQYGGARGMVPSQVSVGSGSASVATDGTVTLTQCSSFELWDVFPKGVTERYRNKFKQPSPVSNTYFFPSRGVNSYHETGEDRYARITRNAKGVMYWSAADVASRVAITPGKTAYIRLDSRSSTSKLRRLRLYWINASGGIIGQVEIGLSGTGWVQHTVSGVAPAATAYVGFYLIADGDDSWMDVRRVRISYDRPIPWFWPGLSPDTSSVVTWTGTANESETILSKDMGDGSGAYQIYFSGLSGSPAQISTRLFRPGVIDVTGYNYTATSTILGSGPTRNSAMGASGMSYWVPTTAGTDRTFGGVLDIHNPNLTSRAPLYMLRSVVAAAGDRHMWEEAGNAPSPASGLMVFCTTGSVYGKIKVVKLS